MRGNSQPLFKLLRAITEKIEMGIRRYDGLSFIYPIHYRSGDLTCDYLFIFVVQNQQESQIVLPSCNLFICLSLFVPGVVDCLFLPQVMCWSCEGHVRIM